MKSMLAATLLLLAIPPALAQDHASAPPAMAVKLISENDLVQILRVSIPAHAKTPMHEVTPRVVVWLSDAHFVDRYADGKTIEERRNAGDAEWVSARQHSGENLSDRAMEFIAVVLKGASGDGNHPVDAHHAQ